MSADYQAISSAPGATPGRLDGVARDGDQVRVEGGRTLTTDGPFVAVKEALGGYLFYEADDPVFPSPPRQGS